MGRIIADIGGKVINEKKASFGMLAFVINDSFLNPILTEMEYKINDYIKDNGNEIIASKVRNELLNLASNRLCDLTLKINQDKLRQIIKEIFENSIGSALNIVLSKLDIAKVVEAKVKAMDVKDLEKLCLSVMKKELNAIVNLGALIGFIIGLINLLIEIYL